MWWECFQFLLYILIQIMWREHAKFAVRFSSAFSGVLVTLGVVAGAGSCGFSAGFSAAFSAGFSAGSSFLGALAAALSSLEIPPEFPKEKDDEVANEKDGAGPDPADDVLAKEKTGAEEGRDGVLKENIGAEEEEVSLLEAVEAVEESVLADVNEKEVGVKEKPSPDEALASVFFSSPTVVVAAVLLVGAGSVVVDVAAVEGVSVVAEPDEDGMEKEKAGASVCFIVGKENPPVLSFVSEELVVKVGVCR